MTRLLAALMMSCVALPAFAAQDSRPGADARVRTATYNPTMPTRIITAPLTSTMVTFDATETIIHVALGDSEAWLVAPTANMLFLKATDGRSTNAQVVTKRADGKPRIYLFDLIVARPASVQVASNGDIVSDTVPPLHHMVSFVYPADQRITHQTQRQARATEMEEQRALARLEVDVFYGDRHWPYTAQGSQKSEPAGVSDNGRLTAFHFPGNQPVPVIYEGACHPKKETIVPTTMLTDLVVVQRVANKFCLRLGDDVTEVTRVCPGQPLCPEPRGYNPGTGTTSPEVIRSIRDASAR